MGIAPPNKGPPLEQLDALIGRIPEHSEVEDLEVRHGKLFVPESCRVERDLPPRVVLQLGGEPGKELPQEGCPLRFRVHGTEDIDVCLAETRSVFPEQRIVWLENLEAVQPRRHRAVDVSDHVRQRDFRDEGVSDKVGSPQE